MISLFSLPSRVDLVRGLSIRVVLVSGLSSLRISVDLVSGLSWWAGFPGEKMYLVKY